MSDLALELELAAVNSYVTTETCRRLFIPFMDGFGFSNIAIDHILKSVQSSDSESPIKLDDALKIAEYIDKEDGLSLNRMIFKSCLKESTRKIFLVDSLAYAMSINNTISDNVLEWHIATNKENHHDPMSFQEIYYFWDAINARERASLTQDPH